MRPDKQKLHATQESGMKDEQKDIANDRQPEALSKRGHETEKSGQGHVRRRDGSTDGEGNDRHDEPRPPSAGS